ncbi:uncharacterized protein ANIA_11467 [Aspergillus nidulans FGSC A4]|uniref:Uncharacterized protein n=1 Tax=Emericella nidulans (strain FGSC A4 / ATCC 38163 / CBS 112.46 / NRRL 194 / M139) TaxID=227321 RepID=C8VF46_EMENI|nr:hypothetical protein [Aspergillus nidulans FGSC A4]CBF81015.1 TPA: hypothetical protein ANIA_11467 [Aspergillus nidulans FGSC A4]
MQIPTGARTRSIIDMSLSSSIFETLGARRSETDATQRKVFERPVIDRHP